MLIFDLWSTSTNGAASYFSPSCTLELFSRAPEMILVVSGALHFIFFNLQRSWKGIFYNFPFAVKEM